MSRTAIKKGEWASMKTGAVWSRGECGMGRVRDQGWFGKGHSGHGASTGIVVSAIQWHVGACSRSRIWAALRVLAMDLLSPCMRHSHITGLW